MWVGGGIYFICVFSIMLFRWAQREDRDAPVSNRPLRVIGSSALS